MVYNSIIYAAASCVTKVRKGRKLHFPTKTIKFLTNETTTGEKINIVSNPPLS